MRFKYLLVALATIVYGNCAAADPLAIQGYLGDARAVDEIALIKPKLGLEIISVDDNEKISASTKGAFSTREVEISLLPGKHKVRIQILGTTSYSGRGLLFDLVVDAHNNAKVEEPRTIEIEAVAGHRYVIEFASTPKTWAPYVTEATNRPELWCGTPRKCK